MLLWKSELPAVVATNEQICDEDDDEPGDDVLFDYVCVQGIEVISEIRHSTSSVRHDAFRQVKTSELGATSTASI